MKVARIRRESQPILRHGLGTTTIIPPGGSGGTVPTSDGSNGIYMGPNVATITANGSNLVQGPFVNFASGSGITLAVSSNTMTITGTGGGGGSGDSNIYDLDWFDVTAYGATGDGTTNDTAAVQAAIDACGTAGGGTVWFPAGVYLISGALRDTGAFNGQLLLPGVSTTSPQVTISFRGPNRPPFAYHGTAIGSQYAIIKSSLTGASGTASVISGGNSGQNNIEVVVQDLVCLAPDNPTFTFWNLATTQGGKRDGLFISTTSVLAASGISQPSHSNAYGIKLPGTANSNLLAEDVICVYGFYTGVLVGELTQAYFITSLTMVGIEIPTTPHSAGLIRHQMTASPIGIKFTGGANYLDIWYDAEHCNPSAGGAYNPGWAVTTYDVDDPSNYFHGHIEWFGVQAGVGPDHLFTINGGTNSSNAEIGPHTAVPSFATPSIALGTAAAAGAASTVIRSDSTITAFDATVPVTQAFSDVAATGSVAFAARRDHRHGMPASPPGGRILLADGHATPFVFTDLLQMDDGSDFMWSDP